MVKIKSFSVGNGDMFYINHNNDSLTIIDCNLTNEKVIQDNILNEIETYKNKKEVTRFISTHPDQDHISGLRMLNEKIKILNFYCVRNNVEKEDETEDFKIYKDLRESHEKHFYLYKDCSRKWMNEGCDERGSSGIDILWPDLENEFYKKKLDNANNGKSPNNISPIIKYSLENGATFLWMGDLEADFMDNIKDKVDLPKVNVLFAPHHGRDSGKIPEGWLKKMKPDLIIIGEAPSKDLNYYQNYNTMTQNSTGDITFCLKERLVNIFSSNKNYSVNFLKNKQIESKENEYYIGSLECENNEI